MGAETKLILCGELAIDLDAQTVTFQGNEITLTALEFDTLTFLAQHLGRYVSAETLLEQVWHCETGGTIDQVKSCIKRLRQKLGSDGEPYIHTQWTRGYRLCDPECLPPPENLKMNGEFDTFLTHF